MTREASIVCFLFGNKVGCLEQVHTRINDLAGNETESVDLPAGPSMHAFGAYEDGLVCGDCYFTDARSWFRLHYQAAINPPLDDWRAIAESFAFVPTDTGESSPSDESTLRAEVLAGGFALEVPAGWQVLAGGPDQAIEGPNSYLDAKRSDGQCVVWRWDAAERGDGGWADLAAFADYFVEEY